MFVYVIIYISGVYKLMAAHHSNIPRQAREKVFMYSLLHLARHFSSPQSNPIFSSLLLSFATFSGKETNSIEIGECDGMTIQTR